MVKTVKRKRSIVSADSVDAEALDASMVASGNAIPVAVATVVRLIAPIVARLAIRYVARKLKRHVSEQTVRAGGQFAGGVVNRVIGRYTDTQ